ncbi:N-6 DNA methylase [Oceanispirochaeta sp.]|uniref:N-6 DNA methylase n=1 Tax=Oceanispirochaeta sp. TaxID=2035350 RepID=UPI002618D02B|nr:N-6 DNA methylase [Oceanispirochaeta sp.]MDA3956140.1 N-6 DNA methylase [Oceanispirochaeta sp.]
MFNLRNLSQTINRKVNDLSIYGQESNQTTWRLAKMNLVIRGIDSSQDNVEINRSL